MCRDGDRERNRRDDAQDNVLKCCCCLDGQPRQYILPLRVLSRREVASTCEGSRRDDHIAIPGLRPSRRTAPSTPATKTSRWGPGPWSILDPSLREQMRTRLASAAKAANLGNRNCTCIGLKAFPTLPGLRQVCDVLKKLSLYGYREGEWAGSLEVV